MENPNGTKFTPHLKQKKNSFKMYADKEQDALVPYFTKTNTLYKKQKWGGKMELWHG